MRFLCLVMLPIAFCSLAPAAERTAAVQAGFSEVQITPAVSMALGGRGCSTQPSDGVLDPLLAQVSVLDDGVGRRLVIVSLDLLGLPADLGARMRREIGVALAVPTAYVLINCSHTHSGPLLNRAAIAGCGPALAEERAYVEELVPKVVEVSRQAARRLLPANVFVHQGESDMAITRRALGAYDIRPDPDGPRDGRVWILRCAGPDGRTRGLLVVYACHPVIVKDDQPTKVSADFPGEVRRRIRAAMGRDVHVQYLQGLAGNLRPRVLADLDAGVFRKHVPGGLQKAGASLAEAVRQAVEKDGRPLRLHLAAAESVVELRRGPPPERSLLEKMADSQHPAEVTAARYWLGEYDRGHQGEKATAWPMGVVCLAKDQWLCWLAGEPMVQWAARVREWFGPRKVVLIGYTQQVEGYLPTDDMLNQGGYEVRSSNYFRSTTPAALAPGVEPAVRGGLWKQVVRIEGRPLTTD